MLAACVASWALHGLGWGPGWRGWFSTVVNNWLGLATDLVPAAVCWVAAYRVRLRRPEVLLAAAAVTFYALGDTYYMAVQTLTGSAPYPSLGDVAYLGFPVLMMAALAAALPRQAVGRAGPVAPAHPAGLARAASSPPVPPPPGAAARSWQRVRIRAAEGGGPVLGGVAGGRVVLEQPADLGGREIRIERRPGQLPDTLLEPLRAQPLDDRLGAPA